MVARVERLVDATGGEQLGLDSAGLAGVPRRLFPCTPTRLATWSDCPRRYRFAYVERPAPPKGPPWAHNAFGSTVHNALRSWYELPEPDRRSAVVAELVDRAWVGEGYRDDAQQQAARARARAMVERYVSTQAPVGDPRGVERTVSFTTDRLAVSGRVDRVDERPSRTRAEGTELVIVDYKTGRQELGVDDARGSAALALYVLGARRTFHADCTRVELHHLPSGTVSGWDHSEESLVRQVRRASAIADEAQAADEAYVASARSVTGPGLEDVAEKLYPPRPGAMCGWCDFVRHCPEGRAAARPRESWAALPDGLRGSGGEKDDEWEATEGR
jgi:RecB family exonuclease